MRWACSQPARQSLQLQNKTNVRRSSQPVRHLHPHPSLPSLISSLTQPRYRRHVLLGSALAVIVVVVPVRSTSKKKKSKKQRSSACCPADAPPSAPLALPWCSSCWQYRYRYSQVKRRGTERGRDGRDGR